METGKKSAIISRSIQDNKPKESESADIRSLKISPGPDISSPINRPSRKIARQALREALELTWDQTLFVDPDVFDPGYMPKQFTCREAQMRELAMQVRPALRQQVHMRPSPAAGSGIAVVAEERRGYDPGCGNRLSSTGPEKPYNCVCRGLPGTGTTTVYRILKLLDSMRLISLHDHIEDGVRKRFVSVRFEPEVIEGMVG